VHVIEWIDDDACFVGSAPPLIGRCCHGATERSVRRQLGRIADEWLAVYETDRRQPPAATGH
jgi:predicted RNase H-like HicB family nuclease